jgi:nitrogen fixation/metabolism regulation signal transduction histidine kinase
MAYDDLRRVRRSRHERRVLFLALLAGAPGTALGLLLLWGGDFQPRLQWTLTLIVGALWLGFAWAVRERVIRPLQTLSNMLAALREGDYSMRARGARVDDPLGLAMFEANTLGETLRRQRLGAVEATELLGRVMDGIEVAIFAFDEDDRLRLVNRAAQRLLAKPAERLLGRRADELGLSECLAGTTPRTLEAVFPGSVGRWEMRRSDFRQDGRPHRLIFLSDLSRALREEERQAWKRLIRVLGHEINNSLAPIKSMAGSLRQLVSRQPKPSDWQDDLRQGLNVIADRSEVLSRFMQSYARLARLPPPELEEMEVGPWVRRVAELETRIGVRVRPGPDTTIRADGDQLEQLLINLVANAADAALETDGGVEVTWRVNGTQLEVRVLDDGPGITETTNLFVPFYTTKPGGSGIGLVLSRQIAEAHGGALTLENRPEARGCVARLRLPVQPP